jgi:hypothetical protein
MQFNLLVHFATAKADFSLIPRQWFYIAHFHHGFGKILPKSNGI